jgi:hypothetical protein
MDRADTLRTVFCNAAVVPLAGLLSFCGRGAGGRRQLVSRGGSPSNRHVCPLTLPTLSPVTALVDHAIPNSILDGRAAVISELIAEAHNAVGVIALVDGVGWPPHAVTMRVLEVDGHEAHWVGRGEERLYRSGSRSARAGQRGGRR